jgi:hypothetical protein
MPRAFPIIFSRRARCLRAGQNITAQCGRVRVGVGRVVHFPVYIEFEVCTSTVFHTHAHKTHTHICRTFILAIANLSLTASKLLVQNHFGERMFDCPTYMATWSFYRNTTNHIPQIGVIDDDVSPFHVIVIGGQEARVNNYRV